jgi:DNA repair photolyase
MSFNDQYLPKLRYENKPTCAECGMCKVNSCQVIRERLRNYNGIRFTSDGFDCALPVSIDSHTVCSFGCLYCFSDNLPQHRESASRKVGQMSLKFLEDLFSGQGGEKHDQFRKALKYDNRNKNGYPCPVQIGAITDPLDNIERQQGWFLEFAKLCIKYDQPVRISTKGKLFLTDEYINVLREKPHLFWVAFSIITPDDNLIEMIDKRAPNATERLKCMKRLTDIGVNASLRFRPMYPNISDKTPNYPKAYKTLIEKATEAGARAISYEVGFVPGMATKDLKKRWQEVERIIDLPLSTIYKGFGKTQACTRASYKWTEDIMHAVHAEAKKNGLTVGVSDPTWKQLNDYGCCCGIPDDDPVFGNWQRKNATKALVDARDTGKEITFADISPEWAKDVLMVNLCNMGAGPLNVFNRKHKTWEDKLREGWNNLRSERGPLVYFQGALQPVRRDTNGDLVYKYVGLERKHLKNPHWKV